MSNYDIIETVATINNQTKVAQKEMEEMLLTMKILLGMTIASILLSLLVLGVCLFNLQNTNALLDGMYYSDQTFIIDTDNKINTSEVDGYEGSLGADTLKDNVEASTRYCQNEDIVHYGNKDVTSECENIDRYSNENYNINL